MIAVLSGVLFAIGLSFVGLFLYSLSKHRNRVSRSFVLISLTTSIYVLGYAFELRSESIEAIKFCLSVQYFGLSFIPTLWLLFAYKFFFNRDPSLKLTLSLFAIPVLTLFFNVTNDYHHLLYADVTAVWYQGFMVVRLTKGPWYLIHIVYSYASLIVGLAYLSRAWRRSHHTARVQSVLLSIGAFVPGSLEVLYLIGLSPYGLDMTPFAASVFAVCYYIALVRHDLFELDEVVWSSLFSELSEGIIVVDDKKRLLDFNDAAREVFGWLNSQNTGVDLSSLPEAHVITDHEEDAFEVEVTRDGAPEHYELRVSELRDNERVLGSVYIILDITRQKQFVRELDNLASYDSGTDIYNRRRLLEEAVKEAARARRLRIGLAVLMIDIDLFKEVNDTYGHLAGDAVIKSVVKVCKERTRNTDIIGRYGGEEFLILLPGAGIGSARAIAEDIRRQVEDMETEFAGHRIRVTISIGVALLGESEESDIYEAIDKADAALYDAKRNGRNRVSCAE